MLTVVLLLVDIVLVLVVVARDLSRIEFRTRVAKVQDLK